MFIKTIQQYYLSLPNQPMTKKELIEKIMEATIKETRMTYWVPAILREDVEKILQDTLPEDKEWDVVEIKRQHKVFLDAMSLMSVENFIKRRSDWIWQKESNE